MGNCATFSDHSASNGGVKTQPKKYKWGYEDWNGPHSWCDHYEEAKGKCQSPIDINLRSLKLAQVSSNSIDEDSGEDGEIVVHWKTCSVTCANNGQTVCWTVCQNKYENGGHVERDGVRYQLLQFHYHIPSEHSFCGKRSPIEFHFVHLNKETETLLVLGFLFEYGENNPFVDMIAAFPPLKPEQRTEQFQIDLPTLAGVEGQYVHYQGSLTTPPCSEGVQWYVNTVINEVSYSQVAWFRQCLDFDNARPVQKLNKRELQIHAAVCPNRKRKPNRDTNHTESFE